MENIEELSYKLTVSQIREIVNECKLRSIALFSDRDGILESLLKEKYSKCQTPKNQ